MCPVFAEVQLDEQQLRTQWLDRAVPTDDDVGVTATEHAVGNATEHDGVVATEHGGVAATEHGLSTGTSANSYYRRRIAIGANAAFRSHGHSMSFSYHRR